MADPRVEAIKRMMQYGQLPLSPNFQDRRAVAGGDPMRWSAMKKDYRGALQTQANQAEYRQLPQADRDRMWETYFQAMRDKRNQYTGGMVPSGDLGDQAGVNDIELKMLFKDLLDDRNKHAHQRLSERITGKIDFDALPPVEDDPVIDQPDIQVPDADYDQKSRV